MIYGIVLVKNVEIVFTLKQIYFSFLAQTAVGWEADKILASTIASSIVGGGGY